MTDLGLLAFSVKLVRTHLFLWTVSIELMLRDYR